MNILFEYLYRDAGNYKNWGEVVFSNRENMNAAELNEQAKTILLDQDFFYADKAKIPDLYF